MNQEYYSWPLQTDTLMSGGVHPRCSCKDSIARHIHLIITTSFGEMPHDLFFGCSIWETDFDNLTTASKNREKIKLSLLQSLHKYEPRLEAVKVEVFIKEMELDTKINGRQVKKKLDVHISGIIKATSEKFSYQDFFFTGPLSYY